MIPLQLRLRNFLSYGATTQTINFEPYRLICLTGKNGHGKSALLDAITWAIWGQARKVAGITRSDDLLVRLGQSHMMVSLDFLCNNQRYRVTRELTFITNKKPQQELQFGFLNEATNTFTPLTEKTIRATQEKITSTLGLDYEACTNSIFLRQGQSDEFSKRAPKERKEILASMLGLDRFETLRSYAINHYRTGCKEVELVHIQCKALEQECAQETSILERFQEVTRTIADFTTCEEGAKKTVLEKEQERTKILEQYNELRIFQNSVEQAAMLQQKKEMDLKNLINLWRKGHRSNRLNVIFQQTQAPSDVIEQKIEELEQLQTRQLTLKEQMFSCMNSLALLKEELQTRFEKEQTVFLQNSTKAQALVHEKTDLATKLNHHILLLSQELAKKTTLHTTLTQECISHEAQLLQIKDETTTLEKYKEFHQTWLSRLATKQQLFDTTCIQIAQIKNLVSTCPLCTQTLNKEKQSLLEKQLSQKTHFFAHQIKRLSLQITLLTSKKQKKEQTQTDREKKQHHLANLEYQIKALANEIMIANHEIDTQKESLKIAQKMCEDASANYAHIQKEFELWKVKQLSLLEQHPDMCAFEKNYMALKTELEGIAYDPVALKTLKEQRNKLREQKEFLRSIHDEIAQQKGRREQIHQLSAEVKERKSLQKKVYECRTKLSILSEQLHTHDTEIKVLKESINNYSEQKIPLIQEQGALTQQLKQITEKKLMLDSHQKKLLKFEQLLDDYQLLASALSKNGIQALLIENTIPEIEHEANALLSKLTDNQAHVIFESVRDLKSGGTKETLDIKISDSMGIRPYELFSGGEAFRIDFALRIAISKFLARRSGTSLQTLIIDEGFGSQDEEGLSHLMDAIYDIQDNFEKIIIVSHLPSMKSQFPTNFFIQKEADGSTISIFEQG